MSNFVSRAGLKLDYALTAFAIDVTGLICADLGSNVGGFVDCLLQRGAAKVYAIEKGYGVLEWKLRKDPRVVAMERTNAMHVELPVKVALVTIDVAWTKQRNILPAAGKLLDGGVGRVITLIKPHYESERGLLRGGVLPVDEVDNVVNQVKCDIQAAGFDVMATVHSPILGGEGNVEVLGLLRKSGFK
jgi:23S rRNA (cytidine1920-2'-O)/16S rRNA (cytidine1409-2'-O)-methyltransferase